LSAHTQPNQPSDDEIRRQQAEAEAMKQKALAMLLDVEARQRLTNVKMVKPELASAVENYLLNAATTGRLNRAITDEELKQILITIQQPKRDFKISRR
jgi:programmed cell death protein 5